jgi:Trk K+ transport system NAD-binding subunit
VCLYRDERFVLADAGTRLDKGDEVIVLAHSRYLDDLRTRWAPAATEGGGDSG